MLKIIRKLAFAVTCSLFAITSANGATTLSGTLTADNVYTAFISLNDSLAGTPFASDGNWPTAESFSGVALTPGLTNYLHIIGTDLGPPKMFIGQFSLSNAGFTFANGTQTLLTDVTNWRASAGPNGTAAGWTTAPSGTPDDLGANGTAPWGNFVAQGIGAGARFIWAAGSPTHSYFSTSITPVAAIPEPSTYALMLAGLGLVGFIARRRRKSPEQ